MSPSAGQKSSSERDPSVLRPVSFDSAEQIGELEFPQPQSGPTPQHLLLTLLGDYWFTRTEHLPSAALVGLLGEFGISEASARTALNRLTRRGFLTSSKVGRKTYYGLDAGALGAWRETLHRVLAFGEREADAWDGQWTMVAFSIPESQRQLRHIVRVRLRIVGFSALYDGLWCSPWDEIVAVRELLAELGVETATFMRATVSPDSPLQPLAAWNLDEITEAYERFEREFTPVLDLARAGRLTASEGLVKRTEAMDSWRQFSKIEPNLPRELLHEEWPRASMRALFIELWDSLAPVAGARCQQIVGRHSPELAALVRAHTSGDTTSTLP